MDTYSLCLHNIITQYITTHTILEICLLIEHQKGTWVKQRWWKNGGVYLYLDGVRVVARAAEDYMEACAETEAEEQRGDVEYWTRQITEVGRVN